MAPTLSLPIPRSALIMTRIQMMGIFFLAAAFLFLPPSLILSIPPFPDLDHYLHPGWPLVSQSTLNDPSLGQFQHIAGVVMVGIGCGYAFALWYFDSWSRCLICLLPKLDSQRLTISFQARATRMDLQVHYGSTHHLSSYVIDGIGQA